jgi:hypothetical protein
LGSRPSQPIASATFSEKIESLSKIRKNGSGSVRERFSKLLNHPMRCGIHGDIEVQDSPATVLDDEPDIEQLESKGGNDEKIHARNHVSVIPEERDPALPFLLVRSSRWQIARDGCEAHTESELLELRLDFSCPPTVLARQSNGERLHFPEIGGRPGPLFEMVRQ